MGKIIGIVLLLVGGFLIYKGVGRKDSIVGGAAQVSADVANKLDGGARIPDHTYYIIGGAVVAVAGLGMVLRGGSKG